MNRLTAVAAVATLVAVAPLVTSRPGASATPQASATPPAASAAPTAPPAAPAPSDTGEAAPVTVQEITVTPAASGSPAMIEAAKLVPETPVSEILVTVSPTPTPSPTVLLTPAPRRGRRFLSPQPTATPTPEPAADATEIPTQPPTPRPVAPIQPTIPDSMLDPNVRSIMGRPIPELSQFAWMLGTWQARNVTQLGNGTQRFLGKNTFVFATTMKGRWIFGADGNASDYFYITYDPFARHWVLVRVNDNPAFGLFISADGWHQNTISFTSNYSFVNGRQYRRKITFIRKDPRTFGIYDEEQLPSGTWTGDEAAELSRAG